MNYKILYYSILFLLILSCNKEKTEVEPQVEETNMEKARVVGYLPIHRFSLSNKIEYCKLTHLNLAFANPDSNGNIIMPSISSIISDAKSANANIVICISLAGAGLTNEQTMNWSNLIDIPDNRPAFIAKIVDYVLSNNLDGVDVDLEWEHVTSGYSGFVIELDKALNAHNKLLTVAFPQTRYSNVSDAALSVFDFINIMSYDATGPWAPSNSGQHSSLQFSKEGIALWNNTIGISSNKLNLGVPFYGYNFVNSTTVNTFTYNEIIRENINNINIDNVGTSYYNGMSTIKYKVNLANDKSIGGIMIWELGQDSFDEYSLLNAIHDEYTSIGIKTTGMCGN
ncbi:glycosyl hydrolase family 18 protein [Flavivirga spongiicola]|uniref:chitinase n=1 Tax=Flavivirga spongiicola TaxID=421621 RepID=A0ABU7XQC8_9FLAO|nr:glycosyl hydrolase family 18 protein [Flavivirga sp. MEBiC05379]MDO5977756.1 glycosyl hydrolase family 18 protein [Flavivirga sp. MEBiC05379]